MIIKTRLGALVAGTLAREPEIKTLGTKDVLVLNVKAQSEKDDAGRWKSLFVDVQCWDGLTEREGMYQKGDFVVAFGREIPRELVELGHDIQEKKPKLEDVIPAKSSYMQMKMAFQAKAFQPKNFTVTKSDGLDYEVGDTVRHVKFGVGIVKNIVEGGRDYEVTVDFDKAGVKKMFAGFAKLKKL